MATLKSAGFQPASSWPLGFLTLALMSTTKTPEGQSQAGWKPAAQSHLATGHSHRLKPAA
jgi:hypothetical protein